MSKRLSGSSATWSWLRGKFLGGLFVLLPAVLTLWVIQLVYGIVNGPADKLLSLLVRAHLLPGSTFALEHFGGHIPGAGFAISLLVVLLVGIGAGNFAGSALLRATERGVRRVPLVSSVYQTAKEAVEALRNLGGSDAKAFQSSPVVYVSLAEKGPRLLGFVTGRTSAKSGAGFLCTVFIPTCPTPFTGYIVMVPEADLAAAPEFSHEDVLKLCFSYGLLSSSKEDSAVRQEQRPAQSGTRQTG
ncbi:MAG: DUF502 domain-containing protein [Candidatus Methylacidiphilaceae bacterium]